MGERPYHCATVTIFEEGLHETSNSVLLLHAIREALLLRQSLLQVVLGGDGLAIEVSQLQGEVTDYPHEGGEVLLVLFRIDIFLTAAVRLDVDVLGQVDDQREVLQGVLVDRADGVVHEIG